MMYLHASLHINIYTKYEQQRKFCLVVASNAKVRQAKLDVARPHECLAVIHKHQRTPSSIKGRAGAMRLHRQSVWPRVRASLGTGNRNPYARTAKLRGADS
jgi:hypothetical protein